MDTVVEINGLTRRFRRTTALDNVSLSIPRGGVFCLVGENGAGKTTLIKHVLGLRARFKSHRHFRLLYLWYDALGTEGATHRAEAAVFADAARADGIHFHATTYQELIASLATSCRGNHTKYIEYLTSRYL